MRTTTLIMTTAALALAACSSDAPAPAEDTVSVEVQEGAAATEPGGPTTTAPDAEGPDAAEPDETAEQSDDPADLALEALTGPEGEYAAAAAYTAVLEEFGADVEPYASILQAEQRHVDALIRQLERYGVEVPEDTWAGELSAPDDLQQAAQAWADGEVANVAMYDDLLARLGDQDPRLERVLTNLRRASQEMHLPAFSAAAEGDGTLTAEELAELHPDH